jgi:hypothetical protein
MRGKELVFSLGKLLRGGILTIDVFFRLDPFFDRGAIRQLQRSLEEL